MIFRRKLYQYALLAVLLETLLPTSFTYGQNAVEEEIKSLLKNKMDAHREWRSIPTSDGVIAKKYGLKLLPQLEHYRNDASERIRWHVHDLLWSVARGLNPDDVVNRQRIVKTLVEGLEDKSHLVQHVVSGRLFSFRAKDFSEASKALIHKMPMGKNPDRGVILVCGVANMKSELPRLKELLYVDEPTLGLPWTSTSWAACKARARMGVQEDINRCIERVEAYPDEIHKIGFLLKNISYIRQPQVVEYLRKYLDSDTVIITGSKTFPISYARRAAAALSRMLPDFPVPGKADSLSYTKEDIERCRKWMSEQKTWEILK